MIRPCLRMDLQIGSSQVSTTILRDQVSPASAKSIPFCGFEAAVIGEYDKTQKCNPFGYRARMCATRMDGQAQAAKEILDGNAPTLQFCLVIGKTPSPLAMMRSIKRKACSSRSVFANMEYKTW